MLRMLRFRGKRAWYLIFAALVTFFIFRWSHDSDAQVQNFELPPLPTPRNDDDVPGDTPARPPAKPSPAVVVERPKDTSEAAVAETRADQPAEPTTPLWAKKKPQTAAVIPESMLAVMFITF